MLTETQHESKTKLLDAALLVIRAKGYAATTVDDICHKAGVTKGSFFHHFKKKDELAVAAAAHFDAMSAGFFATAAYRKMKDPLDRLLGYVDFRREILQGELPEYTCLLGTLVQETYATHPDIRAACDQGLSSHIDDVLLEDIKAAKKLYAPRATWSEESFGLFHSIRPAGRLYFCQGKAKPGGRSESLAHLRRYLEAVFNQPNTGKRKDKS